MGDSRCFLKNLYHLKVSSIKLATFFDQKSKQVKTRLSLHLLYNLRSCEDTDMINDFLTGLKNRQFLSLYLVDEMAKLRFKIFPFVCCLVLSKYNPEKRKFNFWNIRNKIEPLKLYQIKLESTKTLIQPSWERQFHVTIIGYSRWSRKVLRRLFWNHLSCYVTLSYVMLYYVTLRYVMLCYVMS